MTHTKQQTFKYGHWISSIFLIVSSDVKIIISRTKGSSTLFRLILILKVVKNDRDQCHGFDEITLNTSHFIKKDNPEIPYFRSTIQTGFIKSEREEELLELETIHLQMT